jgi:hypothetical protein
MSKKKDRAWFVCPQWAELSARQFATENEAARALGVHPRVLAKLGAGRPLAKSSLRRVLQRLANRHQAGTSVDELIVDTRSR